MEDSTTRLPPAKTVEGREDQLVALATKLAEKQLREGTAPAQVICHYLKLGSTRDRLEREKLKTENELLHAKIENLQSTKRLEELYEGAIRALRSYSGESEYSDYDPENLQ